MDKSVADINKERREEHKTLLNTFKQFPVGTRARVICVAQDFHFFNGDETGTVTKSEDGHLGIIIKFDEPRHFKGGGVQETFNFDPQDLIVLKPVATTEQLAARFHRVYANIPLGLRNDIIAVIDDEPMTWQVVRLEVSNKTAMADRLLEYLDKLELI